MRRWPAEWDEHEAVWIGFPGHFPEWPLKLAEAQEEVAAFANAVHDDGKGEQVVLVCRDEDDARRARLLAQPTIEVLVEPFGDIWLRDTGPIIVDQDGAQRALRFGFNGWGGKFIMAGDETIGERLAQKAGFELENDPLILEGGAIDGDGAGWIATTEQCLINPNRNTDWDKANAESLLLEKFGAEKLLWLGDGLVADHTDGHIDNLARFVAPQTLIIPQADSDEDPNSVIFDDAVRRAEEVGLIVARLPSVGRFELDGDIAPASYMNFYIGNNVVVVPQYGASNDVAAVTALQMLFPDRRVLGLSSRNLLRGGGSFHCCSQQWPSVPKDA